MLEELNGEQQGDQHEGLGFLPAGVAAASAGAGPAGPIIAGIGAAVAGIAKLFGNAAQRGRDEETSGVWLQEDVDLIKELGNQVQGGKITKAQAEAIFKQALEIFKQKIRTLRTKSVVESRLAHQVPDLENLFKKVMAGVQERAQQTPPTSGSGSGSSQTGCPENFGRWPQSGNCVPLQCTQGSRRNQQTGECEYGTYDPSLDLVGDSSSQSSAAGILGLIGLALVTVYLARR